MSLTEDYYGDKMKRNEMACSVHCRDEKSTVVGGRSHARKLIARHRWKCSIKVVCKEIGCEKVDLIYFRIGFNHGFCEHSDNLTK